MRMNLCWANPSDACRPKIMSKTKKTFKNWPQNQKKSANFALIKIFHFAKGMRRSEFSSPRTRRLGWIRAEAMARVPAHSASRLEQSH